MIVHDPRNPAAVKLRDELDRHLPEGMDGEELVVVVGGDGFLLQSVHRHGLDRVYLGLNAGHLGFLLNDVEDWRQVVEALRRRAWRVHPFPLLAAVIEPLGGEPVRDRAINDVYLERMTGQTAHLEVFIDGIRVVDRLVADGIVFSTALGSTAYNFSAGGPACHPALGVLSVTPICPHRPRLHPFALPPTARACIEAHGRHRPVRAVVDGRQVEHIRRVEIGLDEAVVRLAYLEGHDFTGRMIRKILHP